MYYCFHYKFKSNPNKYSVLISSESINEILTALSICTRKIQSPPCLACLSFLIDVSFFMVFKDAKGGVMQI